MNANKRGMVFGLVMAAAALAGAEPWTKGPAENRPRLFKTFGEVLNTPDGLAMDAAGNLYLSAINGVDASYCGHIWKLDRATGRWGVFSPCRVNKGCAAAFPQGIVVGGDGNLYYADNQYFANPHYQSSIMRIVIRDGEPQRIERVVENILLPNGLRWRDGALWFSESMAAHGGKAGGAIYRIPAGELDAAKPVRLLPKEEFARDPHGIAFVETVLRKHGAADPARDPAAAIYRAGPDGLDFDRDGNLYTASFGDGRLWKIAALGGGRYGKPELLDGETLTCCDGLCYDAKRNRLILTGAEQNTLFAWDLSAKKMSVVWGNGDTDGADGLLDQPSEVMFLTPDRLVIVNIDCPSPNMVNSRNDSVHTLSEIRF